MHDITPLANKLHSAYILATGLDLPITMPKIWAWDAWSSKGFTESDLILVIRFIKQRIKENRRRSESLRFKNLIEDTERFYEDLAEARAIARVKKPDYRREAVLQATGRTEQVVTHAARSAADILAGEEAFRKFRKMAENL